MKFVSCVLVFYFIFFQVAYLSAEVQSRSIRIESSFEFPVKPKAKKKSKKNYKPLKDYKIENLLPILILTPIPGLIFVGIGVPIGIIGLWIAGLVLLSLAGILLFISVFSFIESSNNSPPRINKFFGLLAIGIILLLISIVYAILGLAFLIWGLIAAFPVLWISGLIVLLIVVSCFLILMNS
jgi:hypothetical protein